MSQDDQAEFEINLRAPEGTSLESTEVITNRIATAVRRDIPEVDYTLVTIGGDPSHTRNLANIYVRLTPIERRERDQFAIMPVHSDERNAGLRTTAAAMARLWPEEGTSRRLNGYPTFAFGYGRYFFVLLDSNIAADPTQFACAIAPV